MIWAARTICVVSPAFQTATVADSAWCDGLVPLETYPDMMALIDSRGSADHGAVAGELRPAAGQIILLFQWWLWASCLAAIGDGRSDAPSGHRAVASHARLTCRIWSRDHAQG
jgi:hypothetical protein